jgi:hypothetical protein
MIVDKEWKEQKKHEQLGGIIAAEENLKKELCNEHNLLESRDLKKVNELSFDHKKLNDEIMSATKKKEREELIKKRENNLNELNSTLNDFITKLEGEVKILDKDATILKKYIDSRNGTDISVDTSKISDIMYQ